MIPRSEYDAMVKAMTTTIDELTQRIAIMETKWSLWEEEEEEEEEEVHEPQTDMLYEFLNPHLVEVSEHELDSQKWTHRIVTTLPYSLWPGLVKMLDSKPKPMPRPTEDTMALYLYPRKVRFSYCSKKEDSNIDYHVSQEMMDAFKEVVQHYNEEEEDEDEDEEEEEEEDPLICVNLATDGQLVVDTSIMRPTTALCDHLNSLAPSRLEKLSCESFGEYFRTLYKLTKRAKCFWALNGDDLDFRTFSNDLNDADTLKHVYGRDNLVGLVKTLRTMTCR
jgi:hypothetical protein